MINERLHDLSNMVALAIRLVIMPIYFFVIARQYKELGKFTNGFRRLRIILMIITICLTVVTFTSLLINYFAISGSLSTVDINTIQPLVNTLTQLIVAIMLFMIYSGKY